MADETHDEDTAPDEELNDDSNDRSEEKPAKKKRKRRSGKKKRAVAADTESPDNAAADDEASDSSASDDDTSDGDTSDGDTAGGEEAAKVEEPPPPPPEPDDPDAVQALNDIGARLESNEEGNVWRVFFYEDHTDADVTKMHSLHSLKQVWVIGSKATPECVTQLREQFPNATVYA